MKSILHKKNIWPAALIAFFAIFFAVQMALLTFAFQHKPQMVSDKYYAEGFNLKQIAERQAASKATGWNVTARSLPFKSADMPLVELTVVDRTGAPCDSLSGDVAFYRPSNKNLDLAPLPVRYAGQGRYLVFPPHLLTHGAWQAVVHLNRGTQNYLQQLPLFVEK
jgi:nitrogen fixation protein FixH